MHKYFIITFLLSIHFVTQAMEFNQGAFEEMLNKYYSDLLPPFKDHTSELPQKVEPFHPLVLLSAQAVQALGQQKMSHNVPTSLVVFAQLECSSEADGNIIEILTEQAYEPSENLWSIKYLYDTAHKKHLLQLNKKDFTLELPCYNELLHRYNDIIKSVETGWSLLSPGKMKSIVLPAEPNEYKFLIKKTALPREEWLLIYMGFKYGILFTASTMFFGSDGSLGAAPQQLGLKNKIYLAIKENRFQEMLTRFCLNFVIQPRKQTLKSPTVKKPYHPLAVTCAYVVRFLANQKSWQHAKGKFPLCTSIEWDANDAHICEILTTQAYDSTQAGWSLLCKDKERDHNQSSLYLYKKDENTVIPALHKLIRNYSKVFREVAKGWLHDDPTKRKDIEFWGGSNQYKLGIKDKAFVGQDELINWMADKYCIASAESSDTLWNAKKNVYQRPSANSDGTTKIYLKVKKKEFKDMQRKFGLKFSVKQKNNKKNIIASND